jgi:hypothetical protein
MLAFKIVHRRGADRTLHRFALIKHREINDHPIKIVAQYFTSLQWHAKFSIPNVSYAVTADETLCAWRFAIYMASGVDFERMMKSSTPEQRSKGMGVDELDE